VNQVAEASSLRCPEVAVSASLSLLPCYLYLYKQRSDREDLGFVGLSSPPPR
jgi:hypothetical protein